MEGAAPFGVTNFAWASSYVLSVPLGGALVDPPGQRYLPPSLTVVCIKMLLLLRRVGSEASD